MTQTTMMKVKIDTSLITPVDARGIASAFLCAAKRFYENPQNLRAFEAWKKEKYKTEEKT